ncbi:FIG00450847: hypothetical protein [uncultured Candidatus Thioglobus sp.]|nr:FIG00450847: hypothetical protein [uncultured Candidatus Thioglobus sp.]
MQPLTNKTGDVRELTSEDFKRAVPLKEVFPELAKASADRTLSVRPIGRPKSLNPKKLVSIRLDDKILTHFKKTGKGWQTRINDKLLEGIER